MAMQTWDLLRLGNGRLAENCCETVPGDSTRLQAAHGGAAWMEDGMSDVVNEYFKRFYPADWQSAEYTFTTMLGGMREYCGKAEKIFPAMVFADGVRLSVQGHFGSYSCPRDDFADRYSMVECGFPSVRIEELMSYIDGGPESDPLQSVYGYVPVAVVEAIIVAHGGLKP